MRFIYNIVIAGVTILFLLGMGGFVYGEVAIRQAVDASNENLQEVVISEGFGLGRVALLLYDRGLIKNNMLFIYYVWRAGETSNLQAGTYMLSPSMNIKEIANLITAGKVHDSRIRVTIPEGFKIEAIERRFRDSGINIGSGEFIDAANSVYLEGYLYPDTYNFEKDASMEHIITVMKDNFDNRVLPVFQEENPLEISLSDIVILASLIEKEVQSTGDMHGISGVLHNRLDIGMPLQVDATLMYITGKKGPELTNADKTINSPYNTYKFFGLPVAPIANPGIRAIRAAMNPTEHDFLFYLSTPEGETIFSKTLEEHNANRVQFLK